MIDTDHMVLCPARRSSTSPCRCPKPSESETSLGVPDCSLGVGTGGTGLFIHGPYDAIKRAQTLILKGEEDRRKFTILLQQLREILGTSHLPDCPTRLVDCTCDERARIEALQSLADHS